VWLRGEWVKNPLEGLGDGDYEVGWKVLERKLDENRARLVAAYLIKEERIGRVLLAFNGKGDWKCVTDVARITGLSAAYVSKYLKKFARWGYLVL